MPVVHRDDCEFQRRHPLRSRTHRASRPLRPRTIQGRLRESFGPAGAILGASVLFGSIHLVAVVGTIGESLVSVALITTVSLVLGYVYERTRNVVVPALVHGCYNAALLTFTYASVVT